METSPPCVDCGGQTKKHEDDCPCYYCAQMQIPYDLQCKVCMQATEDLFFVDRIYHD